MTGPLMNMYWILDDHEPVATDLITWAKWFETAERHVARTRVGEADVSTVFLGADHNFVGGGAPILFETMIFGGPHSDSVWRYATWAGATTGHARIVAALTAGKDPDE
jgi:hypothetical protein